MRSNDAQQMTSDFEPAPLLISPDGGIAIRPQAKVTRPPPRLCEAGPCVNYHRLALQLDAESPRGSGVDPGGKITGTPEAQPFHVSVKHYCYPSVGIECELGALPVLQCNRWDPKLETDVTTLDKRRVAFLDSAAGKAYREQVAAWDAEQREDNERSTDPLQAWITMLMRADDFLEIHRLGEPEVVLGTWDRESAEHVTVAMLKEDHGEGIYRVWIVRQAVRVQMKKVEVT